jgi:hypothetical protein
MGGRKWHKKLHLLFNPPVFHHTLILHFSSNLKKRAGKTKLKIVHTLAATSLHFSLFRCVDSIIVKQKVIKFSALKLLHGERAAIAMVT